MDILAALLYVLSQPELLFLIVLAALVGVVLGAIPGLTAAAAITMLIPFSYSLDVLPALAFLFVVAKASRFGGSISAILFNTPGTTASIVTQIDGHQMAKKGEADKAIKLAALSSATGDVLGDIFLIVMIGYFSLHALSIGPPETFSVYLLAFSIVIFSMDRNVVKVLCSVLLGILLSSIGLDPISGQERLTFAVLELSSGIELIPLLLGMFVLSEIMMHVVNKTTSQRLSARSFQKPFNASWRELRSYFPTAFFSGVWGALVGVLPGLGSAVAAYTSYNLAKSHAADSENWGKGEPRAVVAAEAANNAVSGSSMIPLLTLGIPGSTIGAVLLGALAIHGLNLGPTLYLGSGELLYRMFACGLLGILAYATMGYCVARPITGLVSRIPMVPLYVAMFVLCFFTAYSIRELHFDLIVMCLAAVLAYGMRKTGFSPIALIISFVLAKGGEESFRQSLLMSESGVYIFFERPLALFCCVASVLIVSLSIYMRRKRAVQFNRS
ncbi:tripartite tricarboxylate transporter permease [Pseudoteredinibacter isoporae]|uniref:tripartite tricarboxylate transporter permease n=1 Tax=Pseudoteredinibacter isoporae TaxID=570281 RepID=UPI00333F0A90